MVALRKRLLSALSYLDPKDREEVAAAFDVATAWHDGQRRVSGEEYITHPAAVALHLSTIEAGKEMLIAALLHDVLEDGRATEEELRDKFGEEVGTLVNGVTKLTKLVYEGDLSTRQVASLRKMLLVASNDIRVILIKLADRLHNVETLGSLRPDKQKRIAMETLDIYVPFARITGLWEWKRKFEEICFPLGMPEESARWHDVIIAARENLQHEREGFVEHLNSVTSKRVHPQLQLMTDYELYQRLYGDITRLEETNQLDSVAVVVAGSSNPADCYQVLGAIHTRYPVHAMSFRDFINAPQPSGYRGLHTTIFLARNHELRLRIQTEEMFEFAMKRKVAAWSGQKNVDIRTSLSSLNRAAFDRDRYLTDLKETVLDRMNVFTTAGEIIALPRGATGVDFAFMLNPDLLFSVGGVRVNGELHEAVYELHDGDTVELAFLENGHDRLERRVLWMEKVKSIEARESLRQNIAQRPESEHESEGRSILEYECQKWRLPLWWLFHWPRTQQRLAQMLGEESFAKVLRKIGSADLAVGKVIATYKELLEKPSMSVLQRILQLLGLLPRSRVLNKQASIINIDVYSLDAPGMIYNVSRCFAERQINISQFKVYALPPHDALYQIRLEVANFKEFSDLYDALLQVPNVKSIKRKN